MHPAVLCDFAHSTEQGSHCTGIDVVHHALCSYACVRARTGAVQTHQHSAPHRHFEIRTQRQSLLWFNCTLVNRTRLCKEGTLPPGITDTVRSHLTRLREAMCASGLGVRARALGPHPFSDLAPCSAARTGVPAHAGWGAIQGYTLFIYTSCRNGSRLRPTQLTYNAYIEPQSKNATHFPLFLSLPTDPVRAAGAAGPRSRTGLLPAASSDSDAVCICQFFLNGPPALLGRAARQQGLAAARGAVAVRPPPAAHDPRHSKGQAIHLEASSQCTREW